MDVERLTELLEAARLSSSRQTPLSYSSATVLDIFSRESEELDRFLATEEFAFAHGSYLFTCGTSQVRLEPNLFVNWLVLRADKVGAAQAAQELSNYIQKDYNDGWQIVALRGIKLSRTEDIGEGLQIMPFSEIPECSMKTVLSLDPTTLRLSGDLSLDKHPAFNPFGLHGEPPACALVKDVGFTPKFVHHQEESRWPKTDKPSLWDTVLLTTLASDSAPVPIADWNILKESTPLSGFIGGSASHPVQIKSPVNSQSWGQREVDDFRDIYSDFLRLDEAEKERVLLAVYRLNQAQNSIDSVAKAIDLGVALESLLLQDSNDQLSQQFSIYGARITSTRDNPTEVLDNYHKFRKLYELRSKAAHNGKLPDQIKVKNQPEKQNCQHFLDVGIALAKSCVRNYIKAGGFKEDDRIGLLLGIEGWDKNSNTDS